LNDELPLEFVTTTNHINH